MRLRSNLITRDELERVAAELSLRAEIGAERDLKRGPDAGRHEIRFTLKPDSADRFRAIDPISGRRKFAVCWHGHYAAMRAIFTIDPAASLETAITTYNGAGEFQGKARATGARNIGSRVEPVAHEDGCRCEGTETRTPTGAADDAGREIGAEIGDRLEEWGQALAAEYLEHEHKAGE